MNEQIFIIGVLVSLIFFEITDISPGGIIVPLYFAYYGDNILKIVYTIIFSLVLYFAIEFLGNFIILFGRRKFALTSILTICIIFLLKIRIFVIGYLIPALITRDFDKQGIFKTISSLLITTYIIKLLMLL